MFVTSKLKYMEDKNKYDLIIIGAGPAGLAASIYASRYKINHLVIGQVFDSSLFKAYSVENYPGFKKIKGADLIQKFYDQAKILGAKIISEETVDITRLCFSQKVDNSNFSLQRNETRQKENSQFPTSGREITSFKITTSLNKIFESRFVLLTLGTKQRKLNIPGEKEFLGKGVSYCAVCDAAFFKNKKTVVVGGSDSAVMAALLLAEYAEKVFLIYRKSELRCEPIKKEQLKKNSKIEIIYETNVAEIRGRDKVEFVKLDKEYKNSLILKADGIFIEAGAVPPEILIRNMGIETDRDGYVIINEKGETNVKGFYAAGDVTNGSNGLRQVVTAVSEGVVAAASVYKKLKDRN